MNCSNAEGSGVIIRLWRSWLEARSARTDARLKNDVGLEMVTDQCEEVNSALDSESSAVSINQSSSDSSAIGINENIAVDSDVGQVSDNSAETEVPTVAPPTPVPRPRRPQRDRRPPTGINQRILPYFHNSQHRTHLKRMIKKIKQNLLPLWICINHFLFFLLISGWESFKPF